VGKRQLKKALIAELEAAQGGIVAAHELIATPMTRSAEHPEVLIRLQDGTGEVIIETTTGLRDI